MHVVGRVAFGAQHSLPEIFNERAVGKGVPVLETVSARMARGAWLAIGPDACARQPLVALAKNPCEGFLIADFSPQDWWCSLPMVCERPVNVIIFKISKCGLVAWLWSV